METRGDDDHDEAPIGDVPEGVGADLYPKHLEYLSRHEAFHEGVLSFPDAAGDRQDIEIAQVTGTEDSDEGSSRTKIVLRSGAVVVASGAVIALAIAAVRYRRRRK
jgi:hypothetical protein